MEHNTDDIDPPEVPSFSHFFTPHVEVEATERRMPHWQLDKGLYFVTWRLAGFIAAVVVAPVGGGETTLATKATRPWDYETREEYRRQFPKRMDDWLDAGYGACVLRDPACAKLRAGEFLYYELPGIQRQMRAWSGDVDD